VGDRVPVPGRSALLLARCDLVVYLLLPRWLVMSRVVRRTIGRSLRREVLWNGNREPPLRTFFTDRDHVVRAAWRSHGRNAAHITHIRAARPDVPIVILTSHREIGHWLRGPLAIAVANGGSPR
jgi:hypothetical protein